MGASFRRAVAPLAGQPQLLLLSQFSRYKTQLQRSVIRGLLVAERDALLATMLSAPENGVHAGQRGGRLGERQPEPLLRATSVGNCVFVPAWCAGGRYA